VRNKKKKKKKKKKTIQRKRGEKGQAICEYGEESFARVEKKKRMKNSWA